MYGPRELSRRIDKQTDIAPYLEHAALKRERLRREHILATIKHGPGTVQIRLAVGRRELLKDLAVHGRRHIGGDSDIVVVDRDIGQLLDFKEVRVDVDNLAHLTWSWSTDILRHLSRWSSHREVAVLVPLLSCCSERARERGRNEAVGLDRGKKVDDLREGEHAREERASKGKEVSQSSVLAVVVCRDKRGGGRQAERVLLLVLEWSGWSGVGEEIRRERELCLEDVEWFRTKRRKEGRKAKMEISTLFIPCGPSTADASLNV